MIVSSVVVLAIVGSAFAFNAKKLGAFCTSGNLSTTNCNKPTINFQRVTGAQNAYYVVDWDGVACSQTCTVSARFIVD